jgi:heme-degrading monooxygenase HmoA
MGKVVLINRFDVPTGRDKEFLSSFLEVNRHMRSQPGYLEHRLHRSLADSESGRYVNVAIWESAEALRAAHQTERFQALTSGPVFQQDFPSSSAIYEVIADTDSEPDLS